MKTEYKVPLIIVGILIAVLSSCLLSYIFALIFIFRIPIPQLDLVVNFITTMFWPVTVITSLVLFREPLSFLIHNIRNLKAGNIEASIQTDQNFIEKELEASSKEISLSEEQILNIRQGIDAVVNENQTKEQQIKQLSELNEYLFIRSEIYEFYFLNHYLVPNSKSVLYWLNERKSESKQNFMEHYKLNLQYSLNEQYQDAIHRFINTQKEKTAILEALKNDFLVIEEGNTITISEKGRRFVEYLSKGTLS